MSLFNWFGGTGQYAAARLWSPRGVPGAGDTAVVAAGDVSVQGRQVGATVVLGGTDAGAPPVLDLRSATLAGLTMPADLPGQPYATLDSPAEYGTVDVRGHSGIGSIEVGAFADPVTDAPYPYGHGPLYAPDSLAVNLAGRATLDAAFDVKDHSTLTVSGGAGSRFNAGSSMIEGGNVVVDAPLDGGTVTMTAGVVFHEGFADQGTLELGGSVGAGVGIDIDVGKLLIDKPLDFAGTLNIRGAEGSGDPSASSYTATQDVMLRGLAASSYAFDDATHRLTLFDGDAALDTIQFSDATTSGSFKMGPYVSVDVVQTTQGVQLRGIMDYSPANSTEIPLHAATA